MAVRLRLALFGKKHAPMFRIIAIDKRKIRDGKYLENLGTYNPMTGEYVQFHPEKIDAWIAKGAIPSDSVKKLYKRFKKGVQPKPKKISQFHTVKPKQAKAALQQAPAEADVASETLAKEKAVADKQEEPKKVEGKSEEKSITSEETKAEVAPKVEAKPEEKPAETKASEIKKEIKAETPKAEEKAEEKKAEKPEAAVEKKRDKEAK